MPLHEKLFSVDATSDELVLASVKQCFDRWCYEWKIHRLRLIMEISLNYRRPLSS